MPLKIKLLSDEPLERIIAGMSKSEKRYFRVTTGFANRKNSTCLKLFDAIEGVRGKTTTKAPFQRHLHVTRHNLFKMIVRSLANFHNKRSGYGKLSNELEGLTILYQRGLYEPCLKRIDRCINQAMEIQSFSLALEFLTLKRKVIIATSPMDQDSLDSIGKQERIAIQQITITSAYWNSMINLREEPPALRSIPTQQLPIQALIVRLHGEFTRHYVEGDTVSASNAIHKLIRLIEENPDSAGNDTRPYLVVLSNQMELFLHLRKWNSIPALLNKIKTVQSTFSAQAFTTHHIRLTLRIFNLELEYYRDTRQWDAAIELAKKVRPLLQSDRLVLPDDYRLLFSYQFAVTHFHRHEYNEALKLLNFINNENFGKVRPDILLYSRLLNIVVHYELGNYTLLEYLIGNARRTLVRDKQLATFQGRVIQLINDLSLAAPKQKIQLFKRAHEYLESREAALDVALDYLDIRTWVNEKLGIRQKRG